MGCEKIDIPGGGFAIVCSHGSRAPQIPLRPPLLKGERGGFVSPRKVETVVISGRVLCLTDKAVKFWTLIKTEWIPLSLIIRNVGVDRDPPLREGEEARITIPLWLAKKMGLAE